MKNCKKATYQVWGSNPRILTENVNHSANRVVLYLSWGIIQILIQFFEKLNLRVKKIIHISGL